MNQRFLFFTFATSLSFAGQASNLGGWEGSLLRMGAGARELAMGNAALADPASAPAAYWNPALLPMSRGLAVDLSAEKQALDRVGGSLGLSKAVGARMGAGLAALWRGDINFKVVDEEDRDLGTAMPWTGYAALGVGWRYSRSGSVGASIGYLQEHFDVAQYYDDVDMIDDNTSAAAITLGWFQNFGRFSTALVARNLGFDKNLQVSWRRSLSRDNSLPSSTGTLPKSLEAGVHYETKLAGRPLRTSLSVLDYQLADTLAAFDPDLHTFQARTGAEWEAFSQGAVRIGFDQGTFTAGLGYLFRPQIGKRKVPLRVDYALFLEREAGFSPFALGTSTRF